MLKLSGINFTPLDGQKKQKKLILKKILKFYLVDIIFFSIFHKEKKMLPLLIL